MAIPDYLSMLLLLVVAGLCCGSASHVGRGDGSANPYETPLLLCVILSVLLCGYSLSNWAAEHPAFFSAADPVQEAADLSRFTIEHPRLAALVGCQPYLLAGMVGVFMLLAFVQVVQRLRRGDL